MPEVDLFETDQITPRVLELITAAPRPGLGAKPLSPELAAQIPQIASESGLAGSLAECGLWLLVGELDRSHTISQNDASDLGSYWHGVMHRREGDFGNSKYWFRRVGAHQVLSELAVTIRERSEQLMEEIDLSDYSDPNGLANALIDDCQSALARFPSKVPDLELICWWEWQLLYRFSISS